MPAVIHPYVTDAGARAGADRRRASHAQHGLDPERAAILARELFGAYVEQITVNGVYHADPHRGTFC